MNLIFIQGGSRWKYDNKGNIYTDANFNDNVWQRYKSICDNLTVILRQEEKIYNYEEAKSKFNSFNLKTGNAVALPDIYKPIKNIFNISKRKLIKKTIKSEIRKADKVIIRSLGNIYTNTALKYAKKFNKSYLVEVTGFAFEGLWYHSLKGKIVAPFKELHYKKMMKNVPYAIYVTNEALQKRYPCKGSTLGCSDVEILITDSKVLDNRIKHLKNHSDKLILGTAAFLDVGWKGQKYVIKALDKLRKNGICNFEYQLIGGGTGTKLKKLITKLNLENNVKIIGTLPHDKVFEWLDNIDIYIQPSMQEGLCRSIVEAMSRACPVICSNVGGNYELINNNFVFKKGNVTSLCNILENINIDSLIDEAKNNFKKSQSYYNDILENKRNSFLKKFMDEAK